MHCKSYSHFFSKKFQHICVSLDVNFNESLTNDIVSFEQLGPVFFDAANSAFCDSAKLISESDIIFALMRYQYDIIFALLLFCSESSRKIKLFEQMLHLRISKLMSNLYDVLFQRGVIFHDVKWK